MSSSSKTLHLEPIDTIHHTKLERVTDLLTESMIDDMTDRLSYWLPQSFALCLTEWMAFTESKFQILATLLQSSIVQVFQSSGFFTSVLYIKNCWLSDFFAEPKIVFRWWVMFSMQHVVFRSNFRTSDCTVLRPDICFSVLFSNALPFPRQYLVLHLSLTQFPKYFSLMSIDVSLQCSIEVNDFDVTSPAKHSVTVYSSGVSHDGPSKTFWLQ